MTGNIIEHYKIVSVLGEGGMGIVYKAFDLKLERYVAVKILSKEAQNNPQFISRFKREAKNQAKLTHPNIVPVYGFTEERNMLGIVMEFVEGETLENIIQKKSRLELKEALQIVKQILEGAAYAHLKGFVHRDIKPSNIIITPEGVVKIMDFGISKSVNDSKGITKTGTKIGTILYMSPEQIKAIDLTNQSDIYSIGITFYEMLAGKTPFDSSTEFEIMEGHLKKSPPKIFDVVGGFSNEIDLIINKSLNKSLNKRYQNCEEFQDDLNKLSLKMTTAETKSTTKFEKKSKVKRKPNIKIRSYIYTLVFLVFISGLFYFVYSTIEDFWKKSKNGNFLNSDLSDSKTTQTKFSDWRQIQCPLSNTLNSVYFLTDSVGFACGNNGAIIETADGGKNWNILSDSSSINLYDITFVNNDNGFIVGSNGTILITNNGGNKWVKYANLTSEALFKVYFLNDNKSGFIIGANGTIFKTYDAGLNWVQVNSPSNEILYDIDFIDNNIGFIVGWDGEIMKSVDQGNNWVVENKFSDQYLRKIKFFNNKVGIIVGGNGTISRTDNGGNDWKIIPSNTISGLYDIGAINENNGIILGDKGIILTTIDGGRNWTINYNGNFASLTSVAETPSKKIFIVGSNGTILTNSK